MKSDVQQITTSKLPRKPDDPIQGIPEPEQYFTAGEIFRNQLLLTIHGTPHKSRGKVDRVVNQLATHQVETPWGMSKAISAKQINWHNEIVMRFYSAKITLQNYEQGVDPEIYRFSVSKSLRVNKEAPQPVGHIYPQELSPSKPLTENSQSATSVL